MQGNTTEIDERNLLRLDALLSHGYGLSPQLVMRSKGLSIEAKALYGYLRGLKPLPKGFDRLYSEYKNGDISARSAATKLGITHPTFLKYVKECDVRLHKDDLVQTHNPRGLTERHAGATDAARNLNHDQDAPDSPLRDR